MSLSSHSDNRMRWVSRLYFSIVGAVSGAADSSLAVAATTERYLLDLP